MTHASNRDKATRRRAERRGHMAESLAAWWLRAKGYRIVAKRFRSPQGEIDLVAVRGRTVAVIEVKARAERDAADAAIGAAQRRRIARAALAFLQRHRAYAGFDLRFDAVFIVSGRLPRHVPDAWRPDF